MASESGRPLLYTAFRHRFGGYDWIPASELNELADWMQWRFPDHPIERADLGLLRRAVGESLPVPPSEPEPAREGEVKRWWMIRRWG
jgi:hypothetical protein